jgi:hypothetical protein
MIRANFIRQDSGIVAKTLQNLIEVVTGNVSIGHQQLLRFNWGLPIRPRLFTDQIDRDLL